MPQRYFHFDARRCTGCGACMVACKDWNDVPAGGQTQWRRVYSIEVGVFPQVDLVHFCVSCCHCARPACAPACPSGAISKESSSGAVLVNPELCRGCRACQQACPYGAPQFAPGDFRMRKCTFCLDRQEKGLAPACVDACPYFALDFGTKELIQARHPGAMPLGAGSFPGVEAEHLATEPSVLINGRSLRSEERAKMRRNGVSVDQMRTAPPLQGAGPDGQGKIPC